VWDAWDDVVRSSRTLLVALALLALTLLASGCGSASTETAEAAEGAEPQRGGSLTVSLSKEPAIINPWLAQGAMAVTWMLIDGTNDPLVLLDQGGRWQPVLAERVPTVENGDVRTTSGGGMDVHLMIRREASWSDGVPLRCDDVAFTWRTVMDKEHLLSNRLGWDALASVDCPSEREVVLRFDEPYALYMSRILALPPLPRHALEGKDFNTFWNDRITVSSGPFLFDEWQRGVRLVLRRNPRYWNAGPRQRPYLDRIVFRFVKDANTLKMQLRMTEADVAMIPTDTNLVAELKATPDVDFAAPPGAVVEQLVFQNGRPPLNNVDVRKAVAYAVDREMLTEVVLRKQVGPAHSTMVPSTPAYESSPFSRFEPSAAKVKKHLEAAGYRRSGTGPWKKGGKALELEFVAAAGSYPYRTRVAQLLQQQLEGHGIGMSITLIMPEVLYSSVAPQGRFDLGEWSELTGVEPAPALLYTCAAIPRKPQWAGKNRFRYCNPKVDALVARADRTADAAARGELIREIDSILADDAVMLPLFFPPDVVAWNQRVGGIVPNAASYHTWNLEDWWLAK